jgi:large subunit ribosomal protein L3
MLKSIIAKKIGMTQSFDEKGNIISVTVVEAGPCVVIGIKTTERDGYNAVQLGFGETEERKLNKSQASVFKKNVIPPKKILKEFRVSDIKSFSVGQEIKADLFKAGDYVDVAGLSKGKGYAGVIKRHNFGMQPTTHGQSDRTRARGSSGGQGPQRVLKGMKMAGRLGNESVTVQKLLVVDVDVDKNIMLIRGSFPGVNRGIVFINKTLKKIPVIIDNKSKDKKKQK